jgi:hypothetical protein
MWEWSCGFFLCPGQCCAEARHVHIGNVGVKLDSRVGVVDNEGKPCLRHRQKVGAPEDAVDGSRELRALPVVHFDVAALNMVERGLNCPLGFHFPPLCFRLAPDFLPLAHGNIIAEKWARREAPR